jgi:hypothetical protein
MNKETVETIRDILLWVQLAISVVAVFFATRFVIEAHGFKKAVKNLKGVKDESSRTN